MNSTLAHGSPAMPTSLLQRSGRACAALAIGAAVLACGAAQAAPAADTAATIRRLEDQNQALATSVGELQRQMAEMRQLLQEMRQQASAADTRQPQMQMQTQQAATAAAQASALATAQNTAQAAQQTAQAALQTANDAAQQLAAQTARSEAWNRLSLWGYGEVYYAAPVHRPDQTQADLARAVFGIGYRFDDKTRFNSEYEVEHAVASADDPGEMELEQFYVEHNFSDRLGARAGLFLIPAGFLNESHEPTNFYGVQRNFVETLIIPSTWREGGLSLFGSTDIGLDWNIGLTTGLDLSKWNFTPEAPLYTSALGLINSGVAPMQATHQELALANARHLSQYAALNWRGMPGLTLGGTVFSGQAVPADVNIGSQRVTLWETHARWQPGKWDLQALYARGSIGNAGAANALFPGTANPMPTRFDGGYVQAAYQLWQGQGMRLAPFARWEKYDLGARYDGIAPGYAATPTAPVPNPSAPTTLEYFAQPRDTVTTLGANFYLNPNVVFKIDFQRFKVNTDFTRLDLGMGLQF